MRTKIFILISIITIFNLNCNEKKVPITQAQKITNIKTIENKVPTSADSNLLTNTIETRINVPENYKRNTLPKNSFQEYLRTLKLKPAGAKVKYYNGKTKLNRGVYSDVIDLEIGTKDLHQCADAVMRLKAEYLWNQGAYDKIHFNFTNGHQVDYSAWKSGKRMKIKGNKTWWVQSASPSNTYDDFWNYMELIFMYAGTASLEKEMITIKIEEAEIGDVLIQGGHPGHAVILVDKAINQQTGKAIFLLAQSYMPAQEIQVLLNPMNTEISPWMELNEGIIQTPEWTFDSSNLKRFAD